MPGKIRDPIVRVETGCSQRMGQLTKFFDKVHALTPSAQLDIDAFQVIVQACNMLAPNPAQEKQIFHLEGFTKMDQTLDGAEVTG